MKKALIAGVASVAIAAMPVAGVFAQESSVNFVDTLNVNVASSCTWTRTLATADSDVTITDGIATAANVIATRTMTAGEKIENFATSTLNVKCNNYSGYKIKATMSGLTGQKSSTDTTTNNDSIEYATALAAGKWTASYDSNGITSGNNFVDTTPTSGSGADDMSTGSTYVVTYGVQAKANQTAGFYTGTVTYELTQNS